jgi:Ran GTPase-activating protein (RanGAP) involved in mRNA processing and transport
MGALSKLDASDNSMFGKDSKTGITAWADVLKATTSITELNLARNGINANDTKILASAISDNRALLQLDMSDNLLSTENERAIAKLCDSKGITVTFEYPMNSPFGGGSDY